MRFLKKVKWYAKSLLFFDGGVLDHPVGGAADGLAALHGGDVGVGLDLFQRFLGAVGALLQVLGDLLIVGTRPSFWATCSRAIRARVFFSAAA